MECETAGILLELVRFDFTGLLFKMEEYERAVLALQNVRDETVSSAGRQGACVTPRDERRETEMMARRQDLK